MEISFEMILALVGALVLGGGVIWYIATMSRFAQLTVKIAE